MGKFIGIVAAVLDEREGEFVQTTELLDFPDEIWVYYCRPHVGAPRPGWADLAAGTLRVSLDPPPSRHDVIEWRPNVTPDMATGSLAYAAEVFGLEWGNNVFHLALPPGYLPVGDSWDMPPLYGHTDGDRFVLGWSILAADWPTFRFETAAPELFAPRAGRLTQDIGRQAREQRRPVLTPYQPGAAIDKTLLLDRLSGRLDMEGALTLIFEVGIDYDELPGETKTAKLRELIRYMERQDQLPRLLGHLRDRYPNVLSSS